jgi:hypothetical protein
MISPQAIGAVIRAAATGAFGLAPVAVLLGLASCTELSPYEARHQLLGMTAINLEECAGIPVDAAQLDKHDLAIDYDYTSGDSAFSLKVLDEISLTIGPKGLCHAVFTLHDGRVSHLHFVGTTGGLTGPLAACAPLVAECVKHRDREPLPPGYDQTIILDQARDRARKQS